MQPHTASLKSVLNQCVYPSDSGDKMWYRAVVLDINSSKASVIYADFGNAEEVPFSRILPIPQELLQTPFRIVRCSLSGEYLAILQGHLSTATFRKIHLFFVVIL